MKLGLSNKAMQTDGSGWGELTVGTIREFKVLQRPRQLAAGR